MYKNFVVFDFETTGFAPPKDKITEIGAVKVINGKIIERFSTLINPERDIPYQITYITGISNDMVRDKPTIEEALPKFIKFCQGLPLVAHNAPFDCKFLRLEAGNLGIEITSPVEDTLKISRQCFPSFPSHKLQDLTQALGIKQNSAHRAWCDAEATAQLYLIMAEMRK